MSKSGIQQFQFFLIITYSLRVPQAGPWECRESAMGVLGGVLGDVEGAPGMPLGLPGYPDLGAIFASPNVLLESSHLYQNPVFDNFNLS